MRERHKGEASFAGVLSGQVTTTEHAVRDVFNAIHKKRGGPPDAPKSLRVEYEIGLHRYQREWICVEHPGYARNKAEAWWRERSSVPCPDTAEEACRLAPAGSVATPTHITVRTVAGEPFERITDYRLGPMPIAREPGQDEAEPPFQPVAASAWAATDVEVPF